MHTHYALFLFFFFNDTATTEIYTLSLHDALPISNNLFNNLIQRNQSAAFSSGKVRPNHETSINIIARRTGKDVNSQDRKSGSAGMPRPISYAVFCLKKKNNERAPATAMRRCPQTS